MSFLTLEFAILFPKVLYRLPSNLDFPKCRREIVASLDFFCSSIQFYVPLSPYLCFISFSYLDLYVLGDDAWIS